MARALLMPWAHSETLKPRGTLILSTGISLAAAGPGGWAIGARVELARSAGWPCFHGGGPWAEAGGAEEGAGVTPGTGPGAGRPVGRPPLRFWWGARRP